MRNLKKFLAVVVAIAVMMTAMVPAFADETAATKTDAQKVETLKVLRGGNDGVTPEYLAKTSSRFQAAIVLLRLVGQYDAAIAFEGTETFKDDSDVNYAEGKAILAYLKAHPEFGFKGIGNEGKFGINQVIVPQQVYKILLQAMGFEQDKDYKYAEILDFAAEKGLSKVAELDEITNNDLAIAIVEALAAKEVGGKTLIEKLVAEKIILEADAIAAGVYTPSVTAKALDISSAVAINSKVIEVSLGTAAVAADLTVANVTVKDSADKAVEVDKVEAAPYSTDGKAVLVTLKADTAAGTYYKVTSGTKTASFGGRPVDTTKPSVSTVASTDYNEIKITFDEAVKKDGIVVALKMKYSPYTVLTTSAITYSGKDAILVSTGDQAASTLYAVEVSGAVDYAGLTMDKSTDKTFVGTAKDANPNAIDTITVNTSKEIEVKYTKKIDSTTTLDKTKYSAKMKYSPYTAVGVESVVAKADTTDTVVVTFDADTTANSLYELTVAAGVTTKYGVATTAALTKTFVAEGKDSTAIESFAAASASNTSVKITAGSSAIKDAFAADTAKEMFVIKQKYSPYTELKISAISIDKNVATLTTDAQTGALYEVTIKTGLKDKAGNALTADKTTTFVGSTVEDKISAVSSAILDSTGTILTVKFNHKVGNTATDVSHYFIDNGVGYPTKAIKDDATTPDPFVVKLTIPKTTDNKVYKITVKGLENADGVAMDAAGITGSFLGKGVSATLPVLSGVVATDKQTLKLIFDRSVEDTSIAGPIWDSTNFQIVGSRIDVVGKTTYGTAGVKDLASYTEYAYKDTSVSDGTVLIVRVNSADFISTNALADGTMQLDGNNTYFKDDASSKANFAPSATDAAAIEVMNVTALNTTSIRVYFTQPVEIEAGQVGNFAHIATTAADRDLEKATFGSGSAELTLLNSVAVDTAKTIYDFKLSGALAAGSNWLVVNKNVNTGIIHDYTNTNAAAYVTIKDEDGTAGGTIEHVREFAGTTTVAGVIDTVPVTMPDARTMVIWYPEAMTATGANGADVTNVANYEVERADGTDLINLGTQVTNKKWDDTNNTVTFTFKTDITASTTNYYVKFGVNLANALGTKKVEKTTTAHEAVISEFARSTVEAAKLSVSTATYNTTARTITIKLNQKAKTDANIEVAAGSGTAFVARFNVNVIIGGVSQALINTDITDVDVLDGTTALGDSNNNYFDTIVITVAAPIAGTFDATGVGDVTVKVSDTTVTGINGMAADTTVKAPLGQN